MCMFVQQEVGGQLQPHSKCLAEPVCVYFLFTIYWLKKLTERSVTVNCLRSLASSSIAERNPGTSASGNLSLPSVILNECRTSISSALVFNLELSCWEEY